MSTGLSFGEFIRSIVGLDMNAAKEAFSAYLSDTSLNSQQIYFLNQIVEYIAKNGLMKDLTVMQDSPFIDRGNIIELFGDRPDLWTGIRMTIQHINDNADVVA
ncbi:type I restriction-modification enzyme R subunit C-terminal domain-containing protein [Lactobacillus sp.]|uniref:type I restriction-modification enzyme R subunit C-terminal domain-containing protein n=1 Tax=Lactobacillus sp. TaxID=1591 RepID=UPI003EF2B9D5